jgi:hypothetical protein
MTPSPVSRRARAAGAAPPPRLGARGPLAGGERARARAQPGQVVVQFVVAAHGSVALVQTVRRVRGGSQPHPR